MEKTRQKAVAVRYEPQYTAPRVVGKGQGFVAHRIIERGREHKVPIYKDEALTNELLGVSLGEQIPPELYEIVARILVFIADLDKRQGYLSR